MFASLMQPSPSSPVIVGLTALILVFLTSTPTFLRIFKKVASNAKVNVPDQISKLYKDEDGIATEDTQKRYSVALPKYIALSCSVLGISASLSIAVFTSVHSSSNLYVENWLSFGTWVRLLSKYLIYTD